MNRPLTVKEAKAMFAAQDEARTLRETRRERCPDCGEYEERKGHMGCQYPQD